MEFQRHRAPVCGPQAQPRCLLHVPGVVVPCGRFLLVRLPSCFSGPSTLGGERGPGTPDFPVPAPPVPLGKLALCCCWFPVLFGVDLTFALPETGVNLAPSLCRGQGFLLGSLPPAGSGNVLSPSSCPFRVHPLVPELPCVLPLVRAKSLQACPSRCDPMDCCPLGSTVRRIL